MKNLIKILLLVLSINVYSNSNLSDIYEVLKIVESENNANAIGDNGRAFGVLQIHKIYVDEVNNRFGTDYTHQDMFNEVCAEEVFYLYMEFAQIRFLKKYKRKATEQDIVRFHNGGMYKGHRIKATEKYYRKYKKVKLKKIKDGTI